MIMAGTNSSDKIRKYNDKANTAVPILPNGMDLATEDVKLKPYLFDSRNKEDENAAGKTANKPPQTGPINLLIRTEITITVPAKNER